VDDQRRRIVEDLSGMLAGTLHCDPLTVALYASDASLYQVSPLGVVCPRNRDDVVTIARYAAETNTPLIARGAGSSVTGAAVGPGLIVDFSRWMRDVEEIGEKTVRVQPGIVRDDLNRLLREQGRYFAPDPSNTGITTVDGMLAVDAAGSHSVRVGSMRDHVREIELVLAGGHVLEFETESLEILQTPPEPTASGSTMLDSAVLSVPDISAAHIKRTIISKLAKLLTDHSELIRERQPALPRNTSGYYLRGVLTAEHLSAPRLLVGSEGTLGLFTSATLHTMPLPAHRGVVLLLFGQLEAAVRAVQEIAPQQPSACDLLDRRLLTLAREADSSFAELISPAAEAALIVEQTGFSDRQVRDRVDMVVRTVEALPGQAIVARDGYTPDEVEFLWSLPSRVVPLLTRLKGTTRPLPFVEDVAVPPAALNDFLVRAQKVFQKHQVTASLYAHATAGQLHLRPFLPVPTEQDGERIESIARDLYQAVFAVGGTISGEHGDGLSRTAFIRSQYGPLYKVFQQIKDIFDPHNLMNPGKIVSDDAHVTRRHFRPPPVPVSDVVDLQLQWDPVALTEETARCNGCGVCRTQSPQMRMCPFFRIDLSEQTSPRAKANAVRNYLCGTLDHREIGSDEMKQLADLCFNCKQCELECPSNVNIPQMMVEAKAAHVAAHGLERADWILSRAHSFGTLGSTTSPLMNWLLGNTAARWVIEKVVGIARQRKLPRFARRPFVHTLRRDLLRPPQQTDAVPSVVYFLGDYANYYDPELARAFVAILKHNGIPVFVPPEQTSSGMAMLSAGDLNAARKVAEQNVRQLAEPAREGAPILCTEPTSALCLKQEYPMLLDHPDVELVAARVIEAGAWLEQLHHQGRLRTDFGPLDLDVGYHTPCHLKALSGSSPLLRLLSLIPELRLHTIDEGCSGMAGAFGLTKANFQTSIRIGWGLISRMRSSDLDIGATECSSCKMQMEQGTATPTLHPLKLLAISYGLMPELRRKLKPTAGGMFIT